jgi:hypothetical protein
MRKILLLSLLMSGVFISVISQNLSLTGRYNIKLAHSRIDDPIPYMRPHNFRIELDYGINRFSEIGCYLGYNKMWTFGRPGSGISMGYKAHVPSYGLVANIHLLPFIIKHENFRFDLYASFKAGGYYVMADELYYPSKGTFEYGIFGGAIFYPFRRMGFFLEYGYGSERYFTGFDPDPRLKYRICPEPVLRYGIAFKFMK